MIEGIGHDNLPEHLKAFCDEQVMVSGYSAHPQSRRWHPRCVLYLFEFFYVVRLFLFFRSFCFSFFFRQFLSLVLYLFFLSFFQSSQFEDPAPSLFTCQQAILNVCHDSRLFIQNNQVVPFRVEPIPKSLQPAAKWGYPHTSFRKDTTEIQELCPKSARPQLRRLGLDEERGRSPGNWRDRKMRQDNIWWDAHTGILHIIWVHGKWQSASLYNKRKLTRWREDLNFFVWWKQYFTHSLRCFVKHCFHHSKIKFISSRHRVISPIYNDTRVL